MVSIRIYAAKMETSVKHIVVDVPEEIAMEMQGVGRTTIHEWARMMLEGDRTPWMNTKQDTTVSVQFERDEDDERDQGSLDSGL